MRRLLFLAGFVALPTFAVPPPCVGFADCAKKTRELRRGLQGAILFSDSLYRYACQLGEPLSCAYLLERLRDSWPIDRSPASLTSATIERALRTECEAGNADSCFGVGLLNERALVDDPSPTQAVAFYEKACDKGHPEACHSLGKLYAVGRGVPLSPARSLHFYLASCKAGWSAACGDVAMVFSKGALVAKDLPRAKRFEARKQQLLAASLTGVKRSCADSFSENCLREHREGFLEWIRDSCSHGALSACSLLAVRYRYGRHEERDLTKFAEMSLWLCDRGDALACLQLSADPHRSPAEKTIYMRRACEHGNAAGCCAQGMFVLLGFGRYGPWRELPSIYRRARLAGAAPFCIGLD